MRSAIHRAVVPWVWALSSGSAVALPIWGGPTYSSVGTPSGAANLILPERPGRSVGEGFAVGYSTSYNPTYPANNADLGYRWDASGNVVSLGDRAVQPFLNGDITVTGIAPHGAVIGTSYSPGLIIPGSGGTSAMYWSPDNVAMGLQKLPSGALQTGGQYTVPRAVNRNNVIVGGGDLWFSVFSITTNLGERAIRWDSPTAMPTNLGTLNVRSDSVGFSRAIALNLVGDVAGISRLYGPADEDLGQRGVRWTPGSTTPIQLGDLGTTASGMTMVEVNGLNAGGTVVGNAELFNAAHAQLGQRAVRWNAGSTTATQLATLGVSTGGTGFSDALDVNDAGTVVGHAKKYVTGTNLSRGIRATRWNAGSTNATELGVLGVDSIGGAESSAYAINNRGIAVGFSDRYASGNFLGTSAVLWRTDGSVLDLNSLLPANSGWQLWIARDISEAGFIAGLADFDPDGAGGQAPYTRGFMMLVPDAGTYGNGDANFDLSVNFDDLLLLAQHYGQSNAALSANVADLNLDGSVNFDDLLRLSQHYGSTALHAATPDTLGAFAADWTLARSMVPEPMVLGWLAAPVLAQRRRAGRERIIARSAPSDLRGCGR